MRLRFSIVLICAVCFLPASARADHGPVVADPTLARYLEIAKAYWGAPEPTCTLEDGTVVHSHAVMANDANPDVAAWAEMGGCRIWLDSDFWPAAPSEQSCNLIAHEWGHLLGHEHSSDPHDLMWPEWTNDVVPQCAEFRAPPVVRPARKTALPRHKRRRAARRSSRWRTCARHRRHAHGRRCFRQWKRSARRSAAGRCRDRATIGPGPC